MQLDDWPCGLLEVDKDGVIVTCNDWLAQRLGHAQGCLIGQDLSAILPRAAQIYMETHVLPILTKQSACEEIALQLRRADGARIPVLLNGISLPGPSRLMRLAVIEARERRSYEQELLATKRALEAQNKEIDRINAQLTVRATELAQTAQEMDLLRAKAVAASESKSGFLAHMSHEIRTPLNGVLGMADLLAETPLQADQRDMLDTIRDSGWSLLSLLNDILDLAKVEAGKLELDPAPFDLSDLVDQLCALHSTNARAKQIGFDLRCENRPAMRRVGDEVRIRQILHNLLGNAVKFTQTGAVTLDVEPIDAREVLLRVSDTGIGMSEEQVSRVFNPFEQAETGTARRFGGTGLGMAIVQRLVQMMGGMIRIESAPGEGTIIALRLPLPADTDAKSDAVPDDTSRDEAGDDVESLRGLRVLAADDNAANRKLLSAHLDRLGVDYVLARNGAEAVDLWRQGAFDIVLLDISMPVMDGLDALCQMRREAERTGAPAPRALAATANVMPEQIAAYLAAGFVGTLPKPFRRKHLIEELHRARST